ncbi:sugar O-acyltransferase (sialic acid O-acetyltransferase NeuD family) [Altererythrobacter atlanticus]|uniref:Acetyltransferase EpsM n=1 Tax=Croceibacterium atlanticum TaxID=1267766 RepID=A0A0F7KQN6_9SPHN|nr:biotin/lipoyl-containing protein [Croceibacterium atlanticum]AKH42848.1 Putative acetyltransferase EpsM [Croceibacterium atlanticum]MBB5731628.1 sugar O-acyltransferase (sialic acid O-acetyltransferase NeuD family) [Croceibacterium atlanticum]
MTTRRAILTMPRLNANEDEARIAVLPLAEGESFEDGTLLFTVETTKAANDVIAPVGGTIGRILVSVDDMIPVGGAICEVELKTDTQPDDLDLKWADEEEADGGSEGTAERHVSAKARERARELGVNVDDVAGKDGKVRVADVERHAAEAPAGGSAQAATGAAPVLKESYGAADAVIFGASGHARAIMDAAQGSGFNLIGCVDAKVPAGTEVLNGLIALGTDDVLQELRDRGVRYAFVGVGGATSNAARKKVFDKLVELGFDLPPLVAPTARLGLGSTLGAASYCLPGASVGPAVTIGDNCIINQNVVIAHDSVIADHVHLAPNAVVAGHCRVGAGSTIGMCATLINGSKVGADCLIHNNVPVTRDIADKTVLTLADILGQFSGG